ncbi:hypothetical protein OR16_02045 [Cupriavidus basilensis OR16]|uniref:Uncharacterized protein n=1 Tax=Cupriavidus basilensis OR16 TaxID=1127483 RepID=H1RYR3_9BURK|nr:hypothetical protein OR16_02045 [Cupriavidus basilensis OR16]
MAWQALGPRWRRKIGALNLQTARTLIAESTDYLREAAAQPFSFTTFRPELADVMAQHIAAYTHSLIEIVFGANADFSADVQRHFDAIGGQDPFQWCLMGRDFLPEYGNGLPTMGAAMTGWVAACLPGSKLPPEATAEAAPRKTALLTAPADVVEPAVEPAKPAE